MTDRSKALADGKGRCHALGMGSSIAFAAASAALAVHAVAPPVQLVPAPITPSGPWKVEYADNMCLLTRDFGEGDSKITLGFKPAPAGEYLRMVVITRNGGAKVQRGDGKLELDGRSPVVARFVAAPIKDQAMRIMAMDVKRSDLASLQSAKRFHIVAGSLDIMLAPTLVGDAMKVLTHCEHDLLVEWGMDPVILANIAQFPRVAREGGGVSYFSTKDYPSEAIRRDEEGTTGARIHVGVNGRVTKCDVYESSGSKILDDQTCYIILTRFRYEPAQGNDGQPVPSFSFQRIRWELPK